MNITLQGTLHKSFVFGFNDIKAKDYIKALFKSKNDELNFQAQIQNAEDVQLLSQSYHLENGCFLDINTQSRLLSFENFLSQNYADFKHFCVVDFIKHNAKIHYKLKETNTKSKLYHLASAYAFAENGWVDKKLLNINNISPYQNILIEGLFYTKEQELLEILKQNENLIRNNFYLKDYDFSKGLKKLLDVSLDILFANISTKNFKPYKLEINSITHEDIERKISFTKLLK
ncbi:hypothetical protein BHR20_07435 [Campylobacter lari]|uniref:hypothetical protein n=1 Tax=Campylobacter lari TaxID=201 RepID=UPI000873CA26|nr:hypothetical protein [Campylobacter lari]EAH4935230.1 hypothetical protein [Campylobacter lari]EAH7837001.1 hypothetical protein [Campylobacter lari]EAI2016705.1 hypothetical protein [Campylobacter lari]EAI2082480.1 hypothetical protein [Campylobacter lari]EAI2314490.1 hypothetical protein [Campylobacter lari]